MRTDESTASFGYWIRRQRQALDLTQAALARQVGCATVTVSKLERDERRPSRQMAELLAVHLAVPEEQRERFLAAALGERAVDLLPLPDQPLEGSSGWEGRGHNLPYQTTQFVGRVEEIAALRQLLAAPERRLVTILGLGGSGKTRLSLEVAADQLAYFEDGVYFVPLAAIEAPEALVTAVAETVGFSFRSQEPPQQQLLHYLQNKNLLLILDNFEHLSQGGSLVQAILQSARLVKILVTSRQRLNLSAETLYPLEGLTVPATNRDGSATGEDYTDNDAAQLFLQTIRHMQPDFAPKPAEAKAIAHICRLVHGMPLAVLLAAGWMELLTPEEIGAEIARNLDFLESRLRDLPPRQRSLRAVFEHSWQLLPEEERLTLQRLSVFVGQFDREAAQTIADAPLGILIALLNRSLLQRTASGFYELHPLVRQYATEKLRADEPEQAAARNRHRVYYCGWLAEIGDEVKGPDQPALLDRIHRAHENIRSAWNWAAEQQQWHAIAQTLDSLYEYYTVRGYFEMGESVFRHTAEQMSKGIRGEGPLADSATFTLARLNARRGKLLLSLGSLPSADALIAESLDTVRQFDNPVETTFCLNALGWSHISQQEFAQAADCFREALALGRQLDNRLLQAESLHYLGVIHDFQGEYAASHSFFQESLRLYRQAGYQPGIAAGLDTVALTAFHTGKYREAEEFSKESLALVLKSHDSIGRLNALGGLANVARAMDASRLPEAKQLMEESLAIARDIGFQRGIIWRLFHLGEIFNQMGRYAEALTALREALELSAQSANSFSLSTGWAILGQTMALLGRFSESRQHLRRSLTSATKNSIVVVVLLALVNVALLLTAEARVNAEGKVSDAEGAARGEDFVAAVEILIQVIGHPAIWYNEKERARRLLAELARELSPQEMASAQARGQSMTLEETCERAQALLNGS